MKVTFLGSSHGIPTAERYCSCTMIEVNGSLYFIDAGAPVIDLLLRMKRHPNEIKAVFCTHHHGDHTDGLLNLTDLCGWAFKEASFDVFVTRAEQGELIKACIAVCAAPVDTSRLRYHKATAGAVYEDENIKVTYFPTRHCEPYPSYAILIEAEGKAVLFTGDMSQRLAKNDFPVYAMENPTDLVVCEMAHFGRAEVEPYVEKLQTKRLCFNHVNYPQGMDKLADIEDMGRSGKFPFPITAPKDGDVIEL